MAATMKGAPEAIALAAKYSKGSPERLAAMADALARIEISFVFGDIVECGVWKGGHLMMARKLTPHRRCWGYDTFSGMTKPTRFDEHRSKNPAMHAVARYKNKQKRGALWNDAPLEQVRGFFEREGLFDDELVRFVVGDVAETLRQAENIPKVIALLRLDTDWYESTKIELEVLYPLLEPGGVLIVDDYGHWMGARKAVDDYFSGPSNPPRFKQIDYTAVMAIKGD